MGNMQLSYEMVLVEICRIAGSKAPTVGAQANLPLCLFHDGLAPSHCGEWITLTLVWVLGHRACAHVHVLLCRRRPP